MRSPSFIVPGRRHGGPVFPRSRGPRYGGLSSCHLSAPRSSAPWVFSVNPVVRGRHVPFRTLLTLETMDLRLPEQRFRNHPSDVVVRPGTPTLYRFLTSSADDDEVDHTMAQRPSARCLPCLATERLPLGDSRRVRPGVQLTPPRLSHARLPVVPLEQCESDDHSRVEGRCTNDRVRRVLWTSLTAFVSGASGGVVFSMGLARCCGGSTTGRLRSRRVGHLWRSSAS